MNESTKIVAGVLAALLLAGAIFYFGDAERSQGRQLNFETIEWQDFYSGYSDRGNLAIQNESDWRDVWQRAHANSLPVPSLPEIDFDMEMVLAVFMGEKPTGGHRIEITQILEKGDSIEVYVREDIPESNCIVTQALTRPYHMVKIPSLDKQIIFYAQEFVNPCDFF